MFTEVTRNLNILIRMDIDTWENELKKVKIFQSISTFSRGTFFVLSLTGDILKNKMIPGPSNSLRSLTFIFLLKIFS